MNLGIINISMFSMCNVGRNRCRCTYPAVPNATLLCQVMVRIHLVAFLQILSPLRCSTNMRTGDEELNLTG